MSQSLINDLLGQLQGAPLQGMAAQLGADTETTSNAIAAALPMLMPSASHSISSGIVPYMHSGDAIPSRLAGITPSQPIFFCPILANAPWMYRLPNTDTALPSTMPSAQ